VFKRILFLTFISFSLCVFYAHKTQAFSQDYVPLDPGRVYQDYFNLINIEPTWSNDLQTNKEVVVAVLDSGVDLNHPDLVDNLWSNHGEVAGNGLDDDFNSYIDDNVGWDFIDSDNIPEPEIIPGYDRVAVNHGTVIAGVIAASRNNNGIVGIAPQVKIMPLRILDPNGQGNTLVLAQAIDYAVENGADVINLSLVGSSYDETLKGSIRDAYDSGVVIVAASGNEAALGIDLDADPRYPVCEIDDVNRVLGVAAVDQNSVLADFSNFGQNCIDISAPGKHFYSTVYQDNNDDQFTEYYAGGWSGTSVAAPVVAATAALIKMQYPQFRPYDIYNIIKSSAQSLQSANPLTYLDLGAGSIDVGGALNLAASRYNQARHIILAPDKGLAPQIFILNEDGEELDSWLAYAEKFTGGVNIAVGDVTGDDVKEIVTAPKAGGGPHIRIFDESGNVLSEFMAYDHRFSGGINIAVGDVTGDGQLNIITAPLSNGGPHIRVFDWQGNLRRQFFAYDDDYFGGVNIAVGDVNNDDKDEIVTVNSIGVGEVKVFDQYRRIKGSFIPYETNHAVNISIGDVNNDGWQEIVTVPAESQIADIKMFSMKGRLKGQFTGFTSSLRSGLEIAVRDLSGDGWPEILAIPHKGSATLLKIYDHLGLEKDSFYLRDAVDKNGYQIEVLNY
jgi:subtilisin family serine protease